MAASQSILDVIAQEVEVVTKVLRLALHHKGAAFEHAFWTVNRLRPGVEAELEDVVWCGLVDGFLDKVVRVQLGQFDGQPAEVGVVVKPPQGAPQDVPERGVAGDAFSERPQLVVVQLKGPLGFYFRSSEGEEQRLVSWAKYGWVAFRVSREEGLSQPAPGGGHFYYY